MKVLFFSPAYPPEMVEFTKALVALGVQVIGVVDAIPSKSVRHLLSGIVHVPSLLDEDRAYPICVDWLKTHTVDLIISNWEPTMLLAARLRARAGLPGMSVDSTLAFRDKTLMRRRVAEAGLRIPKTERAERNQEIWAAAEKIGFPLILKPVAGAGSAKTHRVDSPAELAQACRILETVPVVSVEEFIQGEERTFETICINGKPGFESMSIYRPSCLIARQNERLSPIIQTYRELNEPVLAEGRRLGHSVLTALGMGTGYTHMEWFWTESGEAIFGEVACRSPGANMVDLINYSGNIDSYLGWAMAQVVGELPEYSPSPYSAAIVFKRARGRGTIQRYNGLQQFVQRYGNHIARIDFLPIGQKRRNWQQTFLADGNIVVRHPEFQVTAALAEAVAEHIWIEAGQSN